MKYYPGFNRFDLFDDFFSDAPTKTANVLKTDIHEKDGYYVLSMEAVPLRGNYDLLIGSLTAFCSADKFT